MAPLALPLQHRADIAKITGIGRAESQYETCGRKSCRGNSAHFPSGRKSFHYMPIACRRVFSTPPLLCTTSPMCIPIAPGVTLRVEASCLTILIPIFVREPQS